MVDTIDYVYDGYDNLWEMWVDGHIVMSIDRTEVLVVKEQFDLKVSELEAFRILCGIELLNGIEANARFSDRALLRHIFIVDRDED